ncbi:MAG: hypothetical protein IBJ11_09715 [Phycisphaerales bacterium]|nr:hypothetical protein [Phycisphaerales bacterium]
MPRTAHALIALAAIVAATPALPAAAQVLYAYDDGTGSGNNGYSPTFNPGQYLWGNAFTTQPGGEMITSIRVAFGNIAAGRPVDLLLFSIPDADGFNPRTATLLSRTSAITANTNITNQGQNISNDYPITPTAVSGNFFVAALMNLVGGETPGRFDNQSAAFGARSWVAVDQTINLSNLGASPIYFNLVAPNFPRATFMIRAVGVPAPSAAAPMLAGVALLARRRRPLG